MKRYVTLAASAGFAAFLANPSPAWAQTVGTAGSFAIVGGSAVSANGTGSVINGDVGVSPGTAITGFPAAANTVPPYSTHSNDGAAINAQGAVLTLYNFLAAAGPATPIPAQLDTQNLIPGTYSIGAADLANNGTLTLTGAGIYIFKVSSSLVANVGSQVVLAGGANPCNVFWQVTSFATLNGVNFVGNVVAQAAVTLGVGDQLTGRALTTSLGAVTLSGTNTAGGCSSAAVPPTPGPVVCAVGEPNLSLAKQHTGTFVVGTNVSYTITMGNSGGAPIGQITVTDNLPVGLTFVSATGGGWSCTATGQVVTCNSPAATPGPITLTVTPGADGVPLVTNVATVSGGGDCDVSNNRAFDVATVATSVPTLSEWALLMLAMLLSAAGFVGLRKRTSAQGRDRLQP